MGKFHDNEIKKLKRERKDLDRTMADFERLEAAMLPPKPKPPAKVTAGTSGTLIQMRRKRG
jgi:hypothetical protein